MTRYAVRPVAILSLGALLLGLFAASTSAAMPENLARKAKAWASSEHNAQYLAQFAIDGKIPAAGSTSADLGAAWCVHKAKSGDQAEFRLQWANPVELAELIYWGRTTWFMNECWKDYEVYLDDAKTPAAKGTFRMVHGPQRIKIPKGQVTKVTLKFLNSYGGFNPGALEIQAFGRSLTRAEFAKLSAQTQGQVANVPQLERADPKQVRALIDQLAAIHGASYAQATEHRARLDRLDQALAEANGEGDTRVPLLRRSSVPRGPEALLLRSSGTRADEALDQVEADLVQLQRDVLLFDVDKAVVIRRHEIDATHVYTYHYEGFLAGGGLYAVSLKDPTAKPQLLVESPTGQILDCDLSYDGAKVLFSWRQKQDEGYHLWTVNVDGSGLKQLTAGPWHDYNACWLPDGGIAFLSTRNPQFAYCWHAPVGILHRINPDGSGLRRISANYLNDFTPVVLDDGRLIYSRWEYVDRPAIPIQSLWTINPDGTGLLGYFGNRVISPATFMEARSIPGSTKIICTMTGHNGPARGAIGVIDRSRGVNAQEAIANITPDVPVPKVNEGCGNFEGAKLYSCPLPLDSIRFLVSARGPVLVRTLSGECQSVALPAPASGMQYFSMQPLRPRFRPPVIPSVLPEQSDDYATLFVQDIYNGLEPYVERGEVKTIRVVREMPKSVRIDPSLRAFGFQFPVISCGATYAGKIVLGDVPVKPDGSACFRVPARTPIYFIALDGQGRAVQRMRSFTHLMPGEVQGCVGCHEHRLQASRPNVLVGQASRLPPGASRLPAGASRLPAGASRLPAGASRLPRGNAGETPALLAYSAPPKDLQAPEWGVGGFDYSRIVQPVLDQHCVKCHNPIDAPKRIDLSGGKTDFFNVSYECLARENQGGRGSPYVNWIPSYNGQEWNILETRPKTWGSPASKLAEVILSGHPDKDGKPQVQMDETSRRRILSWMDLNVPYYGTSETAYPERPGCRQIFPDNLKKVLTDVASRRCFECHKEVKSSPRDWLFREWVRITEPELNPFLVAPLAKSAGGSERCGKPIFQSKQDPDYQAILATFKPIQEMLARRPRMDMPGAQPAADVCRTCQ